MKSNRALPAAWLFLLALTVLGPTVGGGRALVIAAFKFFAILWVFMGTRRTHVAWTLGPGMLAIFALALSYLSWGSG